jgi:dTDP-4-amino-4,6-dideoxygalactose transaminase
MIGFNKPHITGKEFEYIQDAILNEKLSGNGKFTKHCHAFFEKRYNFKKVLLTHSCTAALEMAALLIDIKPGDEVIMPSYTFVSTANAFLLRGAKIIFADCTASNPNIDINAIANLINPKTKAIVVVHYAGVACDMAPLLQIANEHGVFVIEDAAQAIDSYYNEKPLGSFGHFAAFSFHETKNIISGEGGMLVVNDEKFIERSEILWEKGTNRSAFFKGQVDKYTWIDKGSSFLPSELTAAFLFAQLEKLDEIQNKRKVIWHQYYEGIERLQIQDLQLPYVNKFASNNAHLFYIVTKDGIQRNALLEHLKSRGVQAIFHYLPLHNSPYYKSICNESPSLPWTDNYGDCLVRLPFYVDLSSADINHIINTIAEFYKVI